MKAQSLVGALFLIGGALPLAACATPPLDSLHVPPGFHVAIYSDAVPGARAMTVGEQGTVFVGSVAGQVYAVTDTQHAGQGDQVRVIATGLNEPTGLTMHDGDLYVSAVDRILRFPDIEAHLDDPPQPQVVTDQLPNQAHANGRFIAFGPDGKLYVSIGAPCNVCAKPGFGKIIRMDSDGGGMEDVALGVRNTAGFDWQPGSNKLWFTDNGRDNLGDNIPSDELNRVDSVGQNFGFPYCHAGNIPDPVFGRVHPCTDFVPPAFKPGPHMATLGMRFYQGSMFPATYHGAIFIAEHGSWNRSSKVGYRVVAVRVQGDKALGQQPFLTGFLDGQDTLGRPVDVQGLQDGSLLVSDDTNGAIYRVTYGQ